MSDEERVADEAGTNRHRGAGDRWLAGEPVDDVAFAHHSEVEFAGGRFDGARGRVELLMALAPEPQYLVALADGSGTVKVRQSSLRAVG